MKDELQELLDQLDDLLSQGVTDGSDALEVAMVAGLAYRLGAKPSAMAQVEAWRQNGGNELLDEIWNELEADEYIEELEGMYGRPTDPEALEEAFWDFDELIAAAIWSNKRSKVKVTARSLASMIREGPEFFAPLAKEARTYARLPTVAEEWGLYDYWFALAEVPLPAPEGKE